MSPGEMASPDYPNDVLFNLESGDRGPTTGETVGILLGLMSAISQFVEEKKVLYEENQSTAVFVNKIYTCTDEEYTNLDKDANTLYLIMGVGIYLGEQLVINQTT